NGRVQQPTDEPRLWSGGNGPLSCYDAEDPSAASITSTAGALKSDECCDALSLIYELAVKHSHIMQGAQIITQQQVMAQVPQQSVMSQVPQQQVMMQSNQQSMQMPTFPTYESTSLSTLQSKITVKSDHIKMSCMRLCLGTSMNIGTSVNMHQMAPQMGVSSMVTQPGVTLMNQSAQMQQQQGFRLMLTSPSSQHQQQSSQSHMMASAMSSQSQLLNQMNQQSQQQHQIVQHSPQIMQHQPTITSQSQSQSQQNSSPGGFGSHLAQGRPPSASYQQGPPIHRLPAPRFPTPSPDNTTHNTNIYRPVMQRGPVTPRLMGQSPAIRQALGHLPSTSSAPCISATTTDRNTPPNSNARILGKDALEAFIKSVDPTETVEEDVSEALIQLVDEFVNDLVDQSAKVAKHRNAPMMEVKDVEYVLEKRFSLFAAPDAPQSGHTAEHSPYTKSPSTEAHRQRMQLIKKFVQKP
ncbi:unnamed protein product, partial [Anisakis simplex]|uniref:Transcription initiation factor TFIID subunit 12 n=1 Tax=Anisakis simplex TaxID=6269 RepID=A0A0M3JR01_ANISI